MEKYDIKDSYESNWGVDGCLFPCTVTWNSHQTSIRYGTCFYKNERLWFI